MMFADAVFIPSEVAYLCVTRLREILLKIPQERKKKGWIYSLVLKVFHKHLPSTEIQNSSPAFLQW